MLGQAEMRRAIWPAITKHIGSDPTDAILLPSRDDRPRADLSRYFLWRRVAGCEGFATVIQSGDSIVKPHDEKPTFQELAASGAPIQSINAAALERSRWVR